MAIPYVQSIDLNDFQLLNFVVHSAGTAPTNASGAGGMMWWDSTNYSLEVYDDNQTAWLPLVIGPSAATTSGNVPVWNSTTGSKLATGIPINTTVATPGVDNALVSEQAVREAISAAISGGVVYKGAYNASTNTPDLEAGTGVLTGDMYTVTVAGDFFTEAVDVGDVLISEADAPTTLAEWTIVNRNIAETFLELTDTPANFTASGGFMLMVNSTPDAVEFVDPSGYGLSNFDNDIVAFGTTDQIPYMNTGATDFEYTDSLKMIGGVLTVANVTISALGVADGSYVKVSSTGVLSRSAEVPLIDLGSYVDGSIIMGGAADWTTLGAGTAGYVLTMGASRPEWSSPGAPSAHALLGTAHSDTATATVSRGSLIYGNSTPQWDELVLGASGQQLQSDGTDLAWSNDAYWANAGRISSGKTIGNVLFIGAWDIDGASPTNFITITSTNTPTMDLTTAVTVGGNAIAYDGGAFHDGFSDFVGDEHIDHTGVSVTISATTDETSVTGAAQTIDSSVSFTIGIADNPVMPGTNDMTIPVGDTAAETGTTPGMFRYNTQTGNFRGNWSGAWQSLIYSGGAFHDGFSDYDSNEHIDHTTVSINTAASSGLAGGGTIAASRSLVLDLNNLATETTIADGDFLAFWDITATAATKNITFSNFVTQVQAGLSAVAKVVTGDVATGATPTITHSLNLTEFTDITVQIWRQSDNKLVGVEITAATKDTVTVNFGSAAINPTLGTFRYVVTGVQE